MWYRKFYKCVCGCEWEDEYDCICNDCCPECNTEMEPYDWEGIDGDETVDDSLWNGKVVE